MSEATGQDAFVWRYFDLHDRRLALTSPRWRPARLRWTEQIARAFHALPPEAPYARQASSPRIDAPGEPPRGGLGLFEEICSVGGGVLIASSGEVVGESLARTEGELQFGPFRRARDGSLDVRVWPLTPMRSLAGDFIFLRQTGDADYAVWLLELLPRIAIAAQFCDLSHFNIAVSRQSAATAQIIRDSLGLFGVRPERVVEVGPQPTFFQRLVFPLPVAAGPTAKSPQAVAVLEYLPARFPGATDAPKRIFVADRARRARLSALFDLFEPLGFVALDPSAMSFAEQVRAFSGAEKIVGLCAGALANLVFAPRGVRVLALTAPGGSESYFGDLTDLKQGRFFSQSLDASPEKSLLDEFLA